MNKKLLPFALLLSIALLITACATTEEAPQPTDTTVPVEVEDTAVVEEQNEMDDEEDQESEDTDSESLTIDAAAIYGSNCSGCHGGDRSGGRGPSLLPERLTGDASQYVKTITDGRGGMPSFSNKLSQDEISALVDWILTTSE
jgi:mono/diheme cytochrome c family protein